MSFYCRITPFFVLQKIDRYILKYTQCFRDKIVVSPFGFESSTWDPSTDNTLPENYTADDITGKASCKITLQHYTGLSENTSNIVVRILVYYYYCLAFVFFKNGFTI